MAFQDPPPLIEDSDLENPEELPSTEDLQEDFPALLGSQPNAEYLSKVA